MLTDATWDGIIGGMAGLLAYTDTSRDAATLASLQREHRVHADAEQEEEE